MKNIKIIVGIILLMLLSACSKDPVPATPDPISKPDPKPIPENKPPGTFDLIGVTNGATIVDLLPSFSWKSATDPDGDPVTYDLLLDNNTDPTTVVATNLTGTSFAVTERLHLIARYHWKVVAKDGKGGSSQSTVYGFTTRNLNMPTAPVTTAAFPTGEAAHTTTLFANLLFTIGGDNGSNNLNEVWNSSDGGQWQQNFLTSAFSPRRDHTTTEFHDELWIIGGREGSNSKNDVWSSGNGSDWLEATPSAPFSKRYGHETVVFDDKLWVIGGYDDSLGNKNDVWYSSDGKNWTMATAAAAFPARYGFTATVFDNKMWVIGGHGLFTRVFNDVWYSNDGVTWTEATNSTAFPARYGHTTVVFDDKLWVIGGADFLSFKELYKNDVWYSGDGANWVPVIDTSPFTPRRDHTAVVFDNKIWVIGGYDGTIQNDVWILD